MENSVQVLSNQIQIREWAGQRVVTFQDIDTVHQRPRGKPEFPGEPGQVH